MCVMHEGTMKDAAPQAVGHCVAGEQLPIAHRQCGNALQEFHSPRPLGGEAVFCRSSTAQRHWAVRQCIA